MLTPNLVYVFMTPSCLIKVCVMSDDVLIPRLGHNNLFNSCVWETEHFFSLFRTFRTVLPQMRHWRWLHSFSHTHARSHNNTASSSSLHKMWTMNIVESVVGCFVGLWCLFVIRCETVMVSGVYRKWVYCLVCRDIQHSYIIFAYTCCCSIILIYILGTHHFIHLPCALQ